MTTDELIKRYGIVRKGSTFSVRNIETAKKEEIADELIRRKSEIIKRLVAIEEEQSRLSAMKEIRAREIQGFGNFTM